jgi:hypothetical protein
MGMSLFERRRDASYDAEHIIVTSDGILWIQVDKTGALGGRRAAKVGRGRGRGRDGLERKGKGATRAA